LAPRPKGLEATTFTLPFFTKLYNQWYKEVEGKNVQVIPSNIDETLTPYGLLLTGSAATAITKKAKVE